MNAQSIIKSGFLVFLMVALIFAGAAWNQPEASAQDGSGYIVDTGQNMCYSNDAVIPCPTEGAAFYGQDAQYQGIEPAYQDNGDGTITDLNTGLMWQKSPGEKVTFEQAMSGAASFNLAGYTDWRVPTIKELYSLMNFNGITGMTAENSVPYLDVLYFDFEYGDEAAGERIIDAQYWSSTEYVSTTMNGNPTTFGVNFADGRIKGYGRGGLMGGREMRQFVRYVRGTSAYGTNDFVDNGDGTITDNVTALIWMQDDSGAFNAGSRGDGSMNWQEALNWCESLTYAGQSDWRLPNAKELQSIVDYTRSPDTTGSAAISPLFNVTQILDPEGQPNYPNFWTSTTHMDGQNLAARAAYVSFGKAQGYMPLGNNSQYTLLDVHGAGAQRSDMKAGDPANFETGLGPQGDIQVIYNYARCVRGGQVEKVSPAYVPMDVQQGPAGGPPDGQGGQQDQNGQGQQQGQGPQGQPPQEAIDACKDQAEGSACEFSPPGRGSVSGTCQNIGNQLACIPENRSAPQ